MSLTIDVEAVLGERRPAPEDAQMCRELRRRLFEDMAGTRFGDPRAVLTLEGLALQLWMADRRAWAERWLAGVARAEGELDIR